MCPSASQDVVQLVSHRCILPVELGSKVFYPSWRLYLTDKRPSLLYLGQKIQGFEFIQDEASSGYSKLDEVVTHFREIMGKFSTLHGDYAHG
jgi:hypothetical protein